MMRKEWKPIHPSSASTRITNPIRDIVDLMKKPENPKKEHLSLSIGDPTIFGNLLNPSNINSQLNENINSRKFNGYNHSVGSLDARKAIAETFSTPNSQLTPEDVILTNGCSGALEIAFTALCEEDSNILIPAPGFSLYLTLCEYRRIEPRFYRLKPEENWQADLIQLESLIDDKTSAILVNNPSNPCGSVYSKKHLEDILSIAEKYHVPIIADEIYGKMVFKGETFYPIASLTKTVPILTVGGIAKVYLSPGWRVGWILIHDRNELFKQVRPGLLKLTQITLGPNTLCQSIIREALFNTPDSFYEDTNRKLQQNAKYLTTELSKIEGLKVVEPKGAMYLMFGIDLNQFTDFSNDVNFSEKLLAEENLMVLPGTIFKCPNFIRLVISPPTDKLQDACSRIADFCERHRNPRSKKRKVS